MTSALALTPHDNPSLRTVRAITEFAVRVADAPGSVPTFAEAEDGPVTRSVAEDAAGGDDVGEPVKASGRGDLRAGRA